MATVLLTTEDDEVLDVDIDEVFEIVVAEVEASYRDRLLALERVNDRLIGELSLLREQARDEALPRMDR